MTMTIGKSQYVVVRAKDHGDAMTLARWAQLKWQPPPDCLILAESLFDASLCLRQLRDKSESGYPLDGPIFIDGVPAYFNRCSTQTHDRRQEWLAKGKFVLEIISE